MFSLYQTSAVSESELYERPEERHPRSVTKQVYADSSIWRVLSASSPVALYTLKRGESVNVLPPAPTLGFAVNLEGSVLAAPGVVEAWGFGVARALAAKRAAAAYLDGDMVVIDVH